MGVAFCDVSDDSCPATIFSCVFSLFLVNFILYARSSYFAYEINVFTSQLNLPLSLSLYLSLSPGGVQAIEVEAIVARGKMCSFVI